MGPAARDDPRATAGPRGLRDYVVVTGAYWIFTLTDGALRMLVLLHLHGLGYTPLEIASLFLLYELCGVVTNLLGGWVGARYGLRSTLLSGLSLQVAACALLALQASALTLPVLLLAQAMGGTAKDLTKMSSKSYIKLVVKEGEGRAVLRLTSLLTGSKNTLKGVGYFLGGLLLAVFGFAGACWGMVGALGVALVAALALLSPAAGRASAKVKLRHLLSREPRINWLSGARFFLFGARDIWFVLALPIYLSATAGWAHPEVSAFLATWIIGYGIVQTLAPFALEQRRLGGRAGVPTATALRGWTLALVVPLGGILAGLHGGLAPVTTLVVGLVAFALVFATNSALHSYLIVAYAARDRIALEVGFYYMANAAGRLVGTVLSGALFQLAGQGTRGLEACIVGSLVFVLASALLCQVLRGVDARAPASGGA